MNRKILYLSLSFVLIIVLGFFINKKYFFGSNNLITSSPTFSVTATPLISPSNENSTPRPYNSDIPSSYIIENFPFQSQAPFANWDELHEEACEEASIILTKWWQDGKSNISAQSMDNEILKMVDWETQNFGSHKDLTAKETANLAQGFYKLELTEIDISSIEDIKKEVAKNNPVIVPTAGRLLGNPYFTQPGPVYHMVVVIGYNGNNIIVQDVGTKRGEEYKYNQNIFYNAIHDWNGIPDNIESGKKVILVLSD